MNQLRKIKNTNFTILEYIILILISSFILIDMISGFLIENGSRPISIYFKLITLLLVVIYLLNTKAFINQILFISLIIILYVVLHYFIINDIILVFKGLDWMIKFFSIIIYFLFFSKLLYLKKEIYIFYFIKYTFIFLLINFLLALLGYGYSMYGEGADSIGSKGFIYAGNELSATTIVVGGLIQIYLIQKRAYIKFFTVAIIMISIGALLSSKVSMFAALIITLCFPIIKAFEKIKKLKIHKKDFYFLSIILIVLPFLTFGFIYYALYVSNLIVRLSFFYKKLDLITLLFSSRNIWTEEALLIFNTKYTFIENIIGSSQRWINYVPSKKMVEIDLIDFLMTYGILGVMLSYGFLIFILIKLYKNRNNPYFAYLVFMIFLVITMSITSGHILNSGVAGTLIATLFAMVNYKKYELK